MTRFQIIVITIFVVFIVGGLVAFATYKGKNEASPLPTISIWGTIPAETFNKYMSIVNGERQNGLVKINYTEKSAESFDKDFIEALASDAGPDAVLLPHTMLLRHIDKFAPISYETIPLRDYRNAYVEETELYLNNDGIIALPWSIDPLVMYWNRDMYTNAGIPTYPKTWEELVQSIPKLTTKDSAGNIQRSAFALGEYRNINHAQELLSTIFFQAGNPIVVRDAGLNPQTARGLKSAFGRDGQLGFEDAVSALTFYTSFSNPADRANYTWNRSLPNSKSFFISGKLGVYFGFASEIFDIKSKNQNLNFDVAPMLVPKAGQNRTTFANLYGFSIVRKSASPIGVLSVLKEIIQPVYMAQFSIDSYLPSVRRDIIASGSKDQYLTIFNDAALISKGWLTPSPMIAEDLFRNMIENVTTGKVGPQESLSDASAKLDVELFNYNGQ